MISINDYIRYIPASPVSVSLLSADVFFIEGADYCYLYDVGNGDSALEAIASVDKPKVVILSHYHKDHTGNIDKVSYERLYVGDTTNNAIGKGEVIEDCLEINDGVSITVKHCVSPHTKGSLIVTVNNEYTLIADLYFTRQNYDKKIAEQMLDTLRATNTKYFIVSHQDGNCVFEKDQMIKDLAEYFGV